MFVTFIIIAYKILYFFSQVLFRTERSSFHEVQKR